MIELWRINNVLRWTGFRVVLEVPTDRTSGTPTKIGMKWVGLYGSKGWRKWEPHTPPFEYRAIHAHVVMTCKELFAPSAAPRKVR